jgi:hypothetical protein
MVHTNTNMLTSAPKTKKLKIKKPKERKMSTNKVTNESRLCQFVGRSNSFSLSLSLVSMVYASGEQAFGKASRNGNVWDPKRGK